jgi:hypothetical protein
MKKLNIITVFFAALVSLCYTTISTCPALGDARILHFSGNCGSCHPDPRTHTSPDSLMTLGISAPDMQSNTRIYPSHTTGPVNIATSLYNNNLSYDIYSLDGSLKGHEVLPAWPSLTVVDLSKLPDGMYLIKIADNHQNSSIYKVIKN